jgi:enoyl-[acyl-carrier protein] reductase I
MENSKYLAGKKALIVGVANDRSLAWAIAEHLHAAGCELAFTYMGDALERRVRPLAESVGAKLILPMNAQSESEMDAVFSKLKSEWGGMDFPFDCVCKSRRP